METPEMTIITENPDYTHFVVDTSLLNIESGWHYKEDAQDHLKDLKEWDQQYQYYRVWSRSYTQQFFNK